LFQNRPFLNPGTLPEDSGNYQCVAENSIINETRRSLEGELYVTERIDGELHIRKMLYSAFIFKKGALDKSSIFPFHQRGCSRYHPDWRSAKKVKSLIS
jgi:hypothetical protein